MADLQKILNGIKEERMAAEAREEEEKTPSKAKKEGSAKKKPAAKKKAAKIVPPPQGDSNLEEEDDEDLNMPDLSDEDEKLVPAVKTPGRQSGRAKGKRMSYAEVDGLTEEE